MNNCNDRKIYSYEMSVFIEKFAAYTISSKPLKKMKQAYSFSAKDRVFVGDYNIKYDRFKVYTYPDLWQSFLNPWLFIKNVLKFISPACIYGSVKEEEGHTIVDYEIKKTEKVKVTALFWLSMSSIFALTGIVNILFNGIDFKSLLIIVIAISWFIITYWIMNVPKMEHDALIRFMEDLED